MEKTGKDLSTDDIETLKARAIGEKNTHLKEACEIALATCSCPICGHVILEARSKCVKAWNLHLAMNSIGG